jgi:hypothetical protein
MNRFANPDDLVHETSIHHLSLLTVEGEYSVLSRGSLLTGIDWADSEALRHCMLEFEGHKDMFKLCGRQFLAILHNHHFPKLHIKE